MTESLHRTLAAALVMLGLAACATSGPPDTAAANYAESERYLVVTVRNDWTPRPSAGGPAPRGRYGPGYRASPEAERIAEAIGLSAAIDYVEAIGIEAIHAHEVELVRKAREELRRANDVTLFGPEDSAGIISFALQGVHPHDLGTILDEEGVAIRAGHHCAQPLMDHLGVPATARASFGLYSDESDIEALMRGIERTRRIFGQ